VVFIQGSTFKKKNSNKSFVIAFQLEHLIGYFRGQEPL